MKSISTIDPVIAENTGYSIVKVHTPVIDIKWVCHFNMVYQYVLFCFQLFAHLANIPNKE